MICNDCRKGGDFTWLVNTDTASIELTEALNSKAKEYHALCRGGNWCDCQHRLGKHFSLIAS